jgi:predicted SAM-dependent methyltransferase
MRELYSWHYGAAKLRYLNRGGWPAGVRKIVIGAAGSFDRPWVPTDIEYLNILREEDWRRWFPPNSLDALLAEHVWEHLSPDEGRLAARYCFRYLRRGGYLRAAVPDGFHPDPAYIETVKVNGTGPSADDHKVLYTYRSFSEVFMSAGFRVELLEYFDEHGRFHQAHWNPIDGRIRRSKKFDRGRRDGIAEYTSIILDAHKPAGASSSSVDDILGPER